ncbi:major facilitator superfamily transporter [Fusarium sp. NRRL 52700]|nr:major facilitator superfamily transporter [Fusarium sp. NRRL 52700]
MGQVPIGQSLQEDSSVSWTAPRVEISQRSSLGECGDLSLSSEHVDDLPVKAEEAVSNGVGMTDEQYDANEKSLVRRLDFTLLPMVWLLYFVNYLNRNNIAAYGFNSFFPTIVKGFKLGNTTLTLILTAPPYLVATATAFATAWSSTRRKNRGYHIAIPQAVACVGFIISIATLNNTARYAAAFLYICGCFSSNAMIFSWASSTLHQTPEKRACATAIINLLSQLGNVWSLYFFPASDGPRYIKVNLLMMAFSGLSVATCVFMRFSLQNANKKLRESGDGINLLTL